MFKPNVDGLVSTVSLFSLGALRRPSLAGLLLLAIALRGCDLISQCLFRNIGSVQDYCDRAMYEQVSTDIEEAAKVPAGV